MNEAVNQEKTHYLYIVVCAPNSIIAKIVKLFKKDKYTHSGICFDEYIDDIYSFSRKYLHFPFIGVFNNENLNSGFLKNCKVLPGKVMRIPVTEEQYNKAKEIVFNMYENKQLYKYNVKGFFSHIININGESKNKYTCSEFVATVIEKTGAAKFNKKAFKIRPQDLSNMTFETIYEGDLFIYYESRKKAKNKIFSDSLI